MQKKQNIKQKEITAGENTIPAGLYVVSTPIGNLRDMTFRAVETLKGADIIACEDTRVSGKLLRHYGIKKPLISYHEHSQESVLEKIIGEIKSGKSVALITDAGTPLVSDPGFDLVKAAQANNLRVFTIPGASASLAALSISGLPSDRFTFVGFAPSKQGKRKEFYKDIKDIAHSVILFESPNRVCDALQDMLDVLGDRAAFIGRELTKMHEEEIPGTISEILADLSQREVIKGEIVIVVSGATKQENPDSEEDIEQMLRSFLNKGSLKDAVANVCEATGKSKNEIYKLALAITK